MVNDPIGDMIARIKNAADARPLQGARRPASKMRERVLDVLPTKATSAATTWWKSPAPSRSSRSS